MPRFGLSALSSSTSATMSLSRDTMGAPSPNCSVLLTCLSPDSRAIHSFHQGGIGSSTMMIETHFLPLPGTVGDGVRDPNIPAVIRTTLPDHVQSALRRYPAVELLCVDVNSTGSVSERKSESSFSSPTASTATSMLQRLPKLCLYSKKDVFLLELGFRNHTYHNSNSSQMDAFEVEGVCLSITEPFDSVLLGSSTSVNILRIRQAPQRSAGYITMCPTEAMAMLTHDTMANEYTLSLYHGAAGGTSALPYSSSSSMVSTPLVYGVEELDDQRDRITDFCFCQSKGSLSLLSALSVVFLKATGEAGQASPILFRGTVVPQDTVTQSLAYLEYQTQKFDGTTARGRQCRSAKQYILDCFPKENVHGQFLTGQARTDAFEWPAQMQGPVLPIPESDDVETLATRVEPIPAGDLCGLMIGHNGYKVEFGLLSPSLFIPRFALEQPQDTMSLDQDSKCGTIVCRIDLRDDESEHCPTCSSIALIRDPLMDAVIHYVTPTNVKSISTTELQIAANDLNRNSFKTDSKSGDNRSGALFSPPSQRTNLTPRTTGWSCLEVSQVEGAKYVVGAVVSGDVQFGHVMVARLSTGDMIAINLTEARQMQELEAMSNAETQQLTIKTNTSEGKGEELQHLHETPPLIDIAKPLIASTIEGLRGMGKLVGSVTPVSDITPDLLAAAAQVKEQTDKSVMLPVTELHEHVAARKKEIVVMFNNQMQQLKTLREMQTRLKGREAAIAEKVEIVKENAESLAVRSATALQAANDLKPTITQAEFDYFQELQRLTERMKQWQEQLDRLNVRVSGFKDAIADGTAMRRTLITAENRHNLTTMLDASAERMKAYTKRVKDVEHEVDDLAMIAGWERDFSSSIGMNQ